VTIAAIDHRARVNVEAHHHGNTLTVAPEPDAPAPPPRAAAILRSPSIDGDPIEASLGLDVDMLGARDVDDAIRRVRTRVPGFTPRVAEACALLKAASTPGGFRRHATPTARIAFFNVPTAPTALEEIVQGARSHNLGERLDGAAGSNADLARRPRFAALVRAVQAEVDALRKADSLSGVGVSDKPHRLMDLSWLRSEDARFELAGAVNRLDRAPFHPESCGEVRLAYRLAYSRSYPAGPISSKLPATIILEHLIPPNRRR
jgi:hypothetical protein